MKSRLPALVAILLVSSLTGLAQYGFGERRGWFSGTPRTAREVGSHSTGTPEWKNSVGFEADVFTFVRVRRASIGGRGRGGGWDTDLPDSDLNLSYRLQQLTSLRADPDGRILLLTDPELAKFPFIYMVEPGSLHLDEDEVLALRRYLQNGGFLMLDDFWGEAEWNNVASVMRRVFPAREFVELSLDHPIYSTVFKIREKGQVPSIGHIIDRSGNVRSDARSSERFDSQEVHHRVISDDKGRIMVIATHNTDNGDGWEREGENPFYFNNFSEKYAYPLGINILFYAMTH